MNNIFCYEKPPLTYAKKIDTITATNFDAELTNTDIIKGEYIDAPKYATLEYNEWRLDGSFRLMEDEAVPLAFWSSAISNTKGNFASSARPKLTITFTEPILLYSMILITEQGSPAKSVMVEVYNGDTRVQGTIGGAQGSNNYYQASLSETYVDKVVITVYSTAPQRYLKIRNIKFGLSVPLPNDKFYNIDLLEEISIPSDKIPMNTLSFTLKDTTYLAYDSLVEYIKQYMTYVELYKDLHIFGGFYIDDIERQGDNKYTVTCMDALSLLENQSYDNVFISIENAPVTLNSVFSNIVDSSNIYYQTAGLPESAVTIKFTSTTKRDALAQVLLCANMTCLKQRDGTFSFTKLDTQNVVKDITERIFTGYNVVDNVPISTLSMSTYSVTKGSALATDNTVSVVEQGNGYVVFAVKFTDLIWVPTAEVGLSYLISFKDKYGEIGVSSSVGSKSNVGAYYFPDKVKIQGNAIMFRLDFETIIPSIRRNQGYEPPYRWLITENGKFLSRGTGDWQWTYTEGQATIFPSTRFRAADWSTLKIYKADSFVRNVDGLQISQSSDIATIYNPSSYKALKTQDLQVETIQLAALEINGVNQMYETVEAVDIPVNDNDEETQSVDVNQHENKIIDNLMQRYYQYNKVFEGKILAEGLHCGDLVSMTLPAYGYVTGTIQKLEYNLINKEIANASILLYI